MKNVHGARNLDKSRFPSGTRRRRLRPWLRALAGTCLAVTMVGGPAIVAGGTAAGAHALVGAAAPNEPCFQPVVSSQPAETAEPFSLVAAPGDAHVLLTWSPPASGPRNL